MLQHPKIFGDIGKLKKKNIFLQWGKSIMLFLGRGPKSIGLKVGLMFEHQNHVRTFSSIDQVCSSEFRAFLSIKKYCILLPENKEDLALTVSKRVL